MLIKTMPTLSIPGERDVIHVHPEFSRWPELLAENKARLSRIPGRQEARADAWRRAVAWSGTADEVARPPEHMVVTGHQAIWHHGGVWIKNVVAQKLCRRINARTIHLVLDHDVKDTALLLPRRDSAGFWDAEKAHLEQTAEVRPLEFRRAPQNEHCRRFWDIVRRGIGNSLSGSLLEECAEDLTDCPEQVATVPGLITRVQMHLNHVLGIGMLYLPVSVLSSMDAFVQFAVSIMADARRFRDCYNRGADTCCHREPGATSHGIRPLEERDEWIEVPFWGNSAAHGRESIFVYHQDGRADIVLDDRMLGTIETKKLGDGVRQLRALLAGHNVLLRPRAVSLTLFVRLYLADWFIHGVGGGIYEKITDHVVEEFYRLPPPSYGVATATMLLPLSVEERVAEEASEAGYGIHDVRHHPERYISSELLRIEPYCSLVRQKRLFLKAANDRTSSRSQRRDAWIALKQTNATLAAAVKETCDGSEDPVSRVETRKRHERAITNREYFFGLFPKEKLLAAMSD